MARLYDYSKWDKIDTDDASSSDDDDGEVVIENDWAEEDRPPPQTVTDVAALADADDRRPPPPPEPVPNVVHGPELPPPPPPPPPLPRWEVDGLPATLVECEARDVENENARGELEELCRGFVWVPGIRGSQRGASRRRRSASRRARSPLAPAFATRADRLPSSKKDATRLAFAAALPHVRARMAGVPPLEGTKKQRRRRAAGDADAARARGRGARLGRAGAQAPPEPVRAPPQDGGVEEAKEEPPPRATAARAARPPPVGGGSSVLDVAARCCGGDEDAGKGRNKGGRPMSDDEIERFRAAVVGLEVAWGADSRASRASSGPRTSRVRGFGSAGEAPTVAAWWEAVGGGEKFGVKAAATALGSGDGDKLAAGSAGGASCSFADALRDRGFAALPGTRGRRRQLEGLAAASGGASVVADAASACWVELGDGQDYAAPPPIAAPPPPAAVLPPPAAAPPVPPPPPPSPPSRAAAAAPLPPPAAGAEDWLGDEDEDLGAVPGGALERLRTIGWGDAAFDAAAATHRADEPERILKFHQLLGAERHRAGVEPHDDACACFGLRVDGVGFHNWSPRRGVTMPYDAASTAPSSPRRAAPSPTSAATASIPSPPSRRATRSRSYFGARRPRPAARRTGAADLRRAAFTPAFAAALPGEMTDGGNDGFFDARSFAASSNAAGLAALVWRRLDTTRNASSQALRHLHDVTICVEIKSSTRLQSHWLISTQVTITPGNHKEQRGRLAALGTPWASLPPELRYGTLLLAGDDRTARRLARDGRRLDRAVFDEQRWTDALHGPHPRARV
ncbi:hypothetical protein JL720_8283 [Aureococcus anophagefferens]|nr:hypothetical protein JL720_8283 [Aureococcus anophagefferens]